MEHIQIPRKHYTNTVALRPACLVLALFLTLSKYTTTNLLYIGTLRILYNFVHQNAMERYANWQ